MSGPAAKPQAVSSQLIEKIQRALQFQKNGEMIEAEALYRQLIRENSDNADVLQIAAIFFDQIENDIFALNLLKKIIAKKKNEPAVLNLIGKSLFKNKDYRESQAYLEQALALNLNDGTANFLMGQLLFRQAQFSKAIIFLQNAMEINPSIAAQNMLAQALLISGRGDEARILLQAAYQRDFYNYETLLYLVNAYGLGSDEALQVILHAMEFDPGREEAKAMFGLFLSQGRAPVGISPRTFNIIFNCFSTKKIEHLFLMAPWLEQFLENSEAKETHEIFLAKNYQDFETIFNREGYKERLLIPFFVKGVKNIPMGTLSVENLYNNLRRYFLEIILKGYSPNQTEKEFLSALSLQSFQNEFVMNEALEETKGLDALDLTQAEHLLIYACYRPLSELPGAPDIFSRKSDLPDYLHETIETHIGQILEEQKLKRSIPTIGKIKGEVSQNVKDQYEENPYPRWRSINFLIPPVWAGVDDAFKPVSNVLIAGCGTGRHIIQTYIGNLMPHITAIDLSSSSLAYATSKVKEYNLKNVKIFQADILQLGVLKEKFDIVESVGVLHHMDKPRAGLAVLAGLLKQDGFMKLGFYSEYGRRDMVKARELIAAKGFEPDLEGIRACRAYINKSDDFARLKKTKDFYTASGCRDLIFHVQEIRYTIPALKELLDSCGLRFENFILPGHQLDLYKASFPEDESCANLDNWDKFERANPQFFEAMYQFTCRKK